MASAFNNQLQILGAAYGRAEVNQRVTRAVDWSANPNTLSINADNATFGDNWPGVPKTLTVVFRYGSDGGVVVKTVKEGETLTLGGPDYQASRDRASGATPQFGKLTIWGASYGPADVTDKVRARVAADQTLDFTADNDTLGDSWPGTRKACVVVSSFQGRPIETDIYEEGAYCATVPGEDLQILGAAYGRADVAARVKAAVDRPASPNTLSIGATNDVFGDSWPGTPKTLTVVYRFGSDGAPGVKVAREGETLTIGVAEHIASRRNASAATGVPGLLTIWGASYGPKDVTDEVSGYLGSDQALSFTAGNAAFGDTWPGVRKACVLVSSYQGQPPRVDIIEEGAGFERRP